MLADLFFVVEEGQANLGNHEKALAMIDAVAVTGADAIEFQLARAEDFYVADHPYFDKYIKREFSDVQRKELIGRAKTRGLKFVAVPFSNRLVEPLREAGCSAFNINASDLTNPDIIDAVVDSGLPFSLSLALATEEEIDWAVNRVRKRKSDVKFALLHGQHPMGSMQAGVDVAATVLGCISSLKTKYDVPVGFVDHTSLMWMPAAAVAAGADFVTKHLALSRNDKGPDWHICLEPDEMKEAVSFAKKMKESMTVDYKKLAPGEEMDRLTMRRSIVASRAIATGSILNRQDILFKRPGTGIDPSRYEEILGKVIMRSMNKDEQISLRDLK